MSLAPALLLRPMNKDRNVLVRANSLFQGYHVTASLPASMTAMVRESGKPYLVDPQTYLFMLPPKRLIDPEKGTLRSAIATLVMGYGAPFKEAAGVRALTPIDFANDQAARCVVERVLAHQRLKFSGQLALPLDPYYDKYQLWDPDEKRENDAPARPPQVLVPPYFYVKAPDDPWLDTNVRFARHALAARQPKDLVYAIVLVAKNLLADRGAIERVAKAYLSVPVDGYLIWPNDFVEEREPLPRLAGLSRLVASLADSGRRVSKLYGGYLSALMSARGLRGFSSGLGYGTSKNAFAFGGGGGGKPVPKFYLPGLHCTLPLVEAERIVRARPSLRCKCSVCVATYGNKMDTFAAMAEDGRSELHFLQVRSSEIHHLTDAGIKDVVKELVKTASDVQKSAVVDASFLRTWAEAVG